MAKKQSRAEFARSFVTGRIALFRKDTGVCLRRNARRRHAYMPALLLCMAFLELLSALREGKLRGDSLAAIRSFRRAYLKDPCYRAPVLEILYLGFRHKIAHTGAPYPVFDTGTDTRLHLYGRKLVTWRIYARGKKDHRALRMEAHAPKYLVKTPTPWPVAYDHRLHVHLDTLRWDLIDAARRYRSAIGRPRWRASFFRAAREIYPRAGT